MSKLYKKKVIRGVFLLFSLLILFIPVGNRTVFVHSQSMDMADIIIIDAGHGGLDGGAVSCTGVHESKLNLEIALKMQDLLHLLGMRTVMIRDSDISVYTQGNTIAAKKVSDIQERVRIVNTTPHALLISIHQNTFSDPKYNGTQVFYNGHGNSKLLAQKLQSSFQNALNPGNKRQYKRSEGVYLMEHINCSGILLECGFLSNPQEERLLRDPDYQKKICAVTATTVSQYLNT